MEPDFEELCNLLDKNNINYSVGICWNLVLTLPIAYK